MRPSLFLVITPGPGERVNLSIASMTAACGVLLDPRLDDLLHERGGLDRLPKLFQGGTRFLWMGAR